MLFRQYERPGTLKECSEMLRHYQDKGKLLAGGTDLVPQMRSGALEIEAVIDLAGVEGLNKIHRFGGNFEIGAMVRLRDLQFDKRLTGAMAVLRKCAGHVSSIQVRNVATLGGNSCNASPSADTVPGLLLLSAEVLTENKQGERRIAIDKFFKGPGQTVLESDEIVKGFLIPEPAENDFTAYFKYSIRGDSDISIIGVGVRLRLSEDKKIEEAAIALTSCAPTPIRIYEAEEMLKNQRCSLDLFEHVAEFCSEKCLPVSDQRATAEYRKKMVKIWVKEVLEQALEVR